MENKTADYDCGSKAILCIVGQDLSDSAELEYALKEFDAEIVYSMTGEVEGADGRCQNLSNMGFLMSQFDGEPFTSVRRTTARIFGPTAVLQYTRSKKPLPTINRPLYCTAMLDVVTCFAGFKKKEELSVFVDLVHHMGGSVRKDFSTSVTHLISNTTTGEKYHYAISLGKPVMSPDWILKCWERRSEVDFVASDLPIAEYKLQPFRFCSISFLDFSLEEQQHMEDLTVKNGGTVCSVIDSILTHIVVDEQNNYESPAVLIEQSGSESAFVVRAEWFWASIQMDVRAGEAFYQLKSAGENGASRNTTPNNRLTPNSRARKRKRLKDTLGQLANLSDVENGSPGMGGSVGTKQRRSTEMTTMSVSPSVLDITVSPSQTTNNDDDHENSLESDATSGRGGGNTWTSHDFQNLSPRHQVCYELLQTEINYVGILNTIITLIKDPLEDASQVGGPLLDPTEFKTIFGNLQPIYDVHKKLKDDLTNLINNWKEESSIGRIVVTYSQELLKAYPPFVNFFEKTKEMLQKCDSMKPRFHAFLKICQGKPECGRQSLVELLIRPVQRLPSVILLLNDILKHTSKGNPDHEVLEEAITCLKEILTHINEDKRKTEGQLTMFGIVNDIENCPANLLSSHRNFVTRADVIELGDGLSGKGDALTMFLFTDVLEVCKRRKGATNSSTLMPTGTLAGGSGSGGGGVLAMRSPSVVSLHSVKAPQKNYKHVELMPLSHVKRVVDIKETDDCRNVFALVCRSNQELKERLYTFTMVLRENEAVGNGKLAFLRTLCRQLANALCRPDAENLLTSLEPHHLDIMSSDVVTNTLSKAVRFASKTSRKVSRAFSFNKTPKTLSRAVSSMISPLTKSATLTPGATFATPLATASKRFPCASAMDLHKLESPSKESPSTPSTTKKIIKSFTFGPTSLGKRV